MTLIGSYLRRGRDERKLWQTASAKFMLHICKAIGLWGYLVLMTKLHQAHLQSVTWVHPRLGLTTEQSLRCYWFFCISLAPPFPMVQSRHWQEQWNRARNWCKVLRQGNIMNGKCQSPYSLSWECFKSRYRCRCRWYRCIDKISMIFTCLKKLHDSEQASLPPCRIWPQTPCISF